MSTPKLSNLNTFFERLNFLRGDRSKACFSKEIGISPPLFSQWEKGATPTYDKVSLISDRLGVTAEWLLTGRAGVTPAQLKESAETGKPIAEIERENEAAMLKGAAKTDTAEEPVNGCASCIELRKEVNFLRSALTSALDRIPKA